MTRMELRILWIKGQILKSVINGVDGENRSLEMMIIDSEDVTKVQPLSNVFYRCNEVKGISVSQNFYGSWILAFKLSLLEWVEFQAQTMKMSWAVVGKGIQKEVQEWRHSSNASSF